MNTEIYLLRHGQPQLQQALLGSTNSNLTLYGWEQLEKSFAQFSDVEIVISSDLNRCAEFAQSLTRSHGKEVVISPYWRECHFGDWDGLTYEQLFQRHGKEANLFFQRPGEFTPPNGEALADFSERVEKGLLELLLKYSGKKVLVVTHAGVIRTLVAWCLQMNYSNANQFQRIGIDYASVTHLSVYQDKKSKQTYNVLSQCYPQIRFMNRIYESVYESGKDIDR